MIEYFNWISEIVQSILVSYGFWGVFAAFFIAQIIFPIPTALLSLASGFFLLGGVPFEPYIPFFKTLVLSIGLPAALGETVGSLFMFFLAFFVGKPIIERWGKFFSLSWRTVEKIQSKFEKSHFDEWALFTLRALPIVPTFPVTFVCGLIRFNLKSYVIFNFLGIFVKVLILASIGWQAGLLYEKYASVISGLEWLGLALIVIILYIFIKKKFPGITLEDK
jgi:membrane protein DedA with SNARE-associated domain